MNHGHTFTYCYTDLLAQGHLLIMTVLPGSYIQEHCSFRVCSMPPHRSVITRLCKAVVGTTLSAICQRFFSYNILYTVPTF